MLGVFIDVLDSVIPIHMTIIPLPNLEWIQPFCLPGANWSLHLRLCILHVLKWSWRSLLIGSLRVLNKMTSPDGKVCLLSSPLLPSMVWTKWLRSAFIISTSRRSDGSIFAFLSAYKYWEKVVDQLWSFVGCVCLRSNPQQRVSKQGKS